MKARFAATLLISTIGSLDVAENHIREWSGHYVENQDYSIDQYNRIVSIHKNSVSSIPWKFEAYDDVTGEPGVIDDIRIEPTGTVGYIRLRIVGDGGVGHQYGARDVKRIDLLTNADDTTEVYSIDISGDFGEIGPMSANSVGVGGVYVGGDILGDIEIEYLGGHIECNSMANLTVSGPTPPGAPPLFTPNITIHGSYGHTIDVYGSLGDVEVTQLTGRIEVSNNLNSLLVWPRDLTGEVVVGLDVVDSISGASHVTGSIEIGRDSFGLLIKHLGPTGTVQVGRDLWNTQSTLGLEGTVTVGRDVINGFMVPAIGMTGDLVVGRNMTGTIIVGDLLFGGRSDGQRHHRGRPYRRRPYLG